MSFKQISILFLSAILLTNCYELEENSFMQGLESINETDLLKSVEYFSSPELDGRLSGSEGYYKAAEYSKEKFKTLGLKPAFGESYFQPLNIEYNEIKETSFKIKNKSGEEKFYEAGKDYVCRGFSGSGDVNAKVVFCGYGISMPETGYDDYKNINVKGKVVLIFKQNPRWKLDNTSWPPAYPRSKVEAAYKHGAKAVLFVSRPNDNRPQPVIGSVYSGEGTQRENIPQLQISVETANDIFKNSGYSLNSLQAKIDENKKPNSVALKNSVRIKVEAEYIKEKETVNVGAILLGKNPELKNEYVVIGAHLDHVGRQGEIYFPGANDNASGSAALIEVAEAFVKGHVKPERSVIFVLFASEEAGLFGSDYFVKNFDPGTSSISAMFNIDCVGYGDSIQCHNGKGAPKLWEMAKTLDKKFTKQMTRLTWGGGGADATPFHKAGVPAIYFVTTKSYAHLHAVSDKPETLNGKLFEKITKLIYLTSYEAAIGKYEREVVNN